MTLVLLTAVSGHAEPVRINSLGYTPDAVKTAAVASEATEFRLKKATSGRVVMKGLLSEPQQKQEVGQTLRYADFSDFRKKGTYVVEIPGVGVSEAFRIGKDVYHVPFVTAVVRSRCVVITDTEERKEGTIEAGLLTVDADKVTVLTSALAWD